MMNKIMDRQLDFQTVIAKKDNLEEIIESYQAFGWQKKQIKEDDQYENILEVSFERDHNIKNKDDLQFLQVNMEVELNRIVKLEKHRHFKSTLFGSIFGLLSAGLIAVAVYILMNFNSVSMLVLGILSGVLGLTILTWFAIFIKKIIKKENEAFEIKRQKNKKEVAEFIDKAKSLLGEGYGKD